MRDTAGADPPAHTYRTGERDRMYSKPLRHPPPAHARRTRKEHAMRDTGWG